MNCIIIDDDPLSLRVVEEFVNRTDFLDLKYTFHDAVEAINTINVSEDDIDLIFLDIEMPEMSGIDFLNTVKDLPQIIIISSQEKYALQAFDYDVVDYLLKPITFSRFYKAVKKARDNISVSGEQKQESDEIFIKKDSALVRLKYEDILWVEAMENYVVINSYDEKFTIHFTMKSIINQLPSDRFKRVHRSYIVNIRNIDRIEDNYVIINSKRGEKHIPIGKAYKEKFLKELNLIGK
ncbi:MAG: LytR/AlgR family response regulator transcription factor [Bacteroidales bacterium]